ncbi:MAG: DUF4358 domain-containing protein [Oscillospiraceae bacterium]
MKKILAAIAAVAMTGLLLAGCASKTEEEVTTAETTVETTTEATEEITEAVEDTTVSEEEIIEDDTASEENEEEFVMMPMFDEENVNPLQDLVIAAMGDFSEWPMLAEVTDEDIISDYFLLDKNNANYEQFIAMQCPMSAQMCEIIIIKTTDTDAAKADLEARQKKAQDTDAFYPNDIERAANSIVGAKGDYAYFLFCENPTAAEELLTAAIA